MQSKQILTQSMKINSAFSVTYHLEINPIIIIMALISFVFNMAKGACKYYISTLGEGGSLKEMLILLMLLGGKVRYGMYFSK